jgi:hypothetical protein
MNNFCLTKLRGPVVKLTTSVASYCDDTLEISSRLHDLDIFDAAEVSIFIDIHQKHDSQSFPGILGRREHNQLDGKGMWHTLEIRDVHTDL